MEQFNLDKWLQDKSRKVVTRDGRPVRILDYNLKGDEPICIAVDDKTQEFITTVDEDGHCLKDKTGWHESNFDLFFADEEEDEFETTMISFSHAMFEYLLESTNVKVDVKAWKNKLLDLARKEILKDLPKYKEAKEDRVVPNWVVKLNKDGNITFSDVVYKGEYFITFQSLKTLPKEE